MSDRTLHLRRWGFAALLLFAAVALRVPALKRQIWNLDEGSTVTMAQQILAGQIPYLEAADNRTPLVPYLKAALFAVAGDWNVTAVHLAVALMLGLTAILLWQIARRLGHEAAGVMAAIVFTWLSVGMLPAVDAMTAHTGWFVIFFSSLGFWIFSRTVHQFSWTAVLATGLAFGLSQLAKQPGLLDFGVCVVLVLLLAGFERESRLRLTQFGLPLLAGFLAPLIVMVAYFHSRGALDDLVFYAWTYNTHYYVPEVPLADRLLAVRVPFVLLLERMPVVLVLGVIAAGDLLRDALRSLRRRALASGVLAWLILGWTASGLVSTMLSGRDFSHYSMQVLPGLSLACGWLLARLHARAQTWRDSGQMKRWRTWQAGAALILASLTLPTLYWLAKLDTNDGLTAEVGAVVREHTRPDEPIFVWGYVPELHVYAERLPSTRFFYTNWVTGLIPWTNVDWLKDTAYAVIPGTPEQLRRDFDRRPPAVVVDSGNTRGYAKYPLRQQAWLQDKVRFEFAEVAPDYTNRRGFRVYRRIADAPYGQPFPTGTPVDPAIKISAVALTHPATIPVRVDFPAGTGRVELYKDNALYRRIECPSGHAGTVVFSVIDTDLPTGERRLQAVAYGQETRASAPHATVVDPAHPGPTPAGPPLEFNGKSLLPIEATNLHGLMKPSLQPSGWDASTPSRIVYPRPTGLYTLEFEYGINDAVHKEPGKWPHDGIDVVLQFEPAQGGPRLTLFRRHLNAQVRDEDRGLQKTRVILPLNSPGRLALLVSPGALSDITSDMAYWKSIRGEGPPGGIFFQDKMLNAHYLEIPLGLDRATVEGREVVMAHAPSHMDFTLQKGMHRLTGVLGLLPGAWTGPQKSAGAIFEVWHLPVTGEPRKLFERRIDPRNNLKERAPIPFTVDLPYPLEGGLRLSTRPAHPQDNAFNYTYWGRLVAEEFHASLQAPDQTVLSIDAETVYGFSELDESNRRVTFAHAPSRLAFPLRPAWRRLTGQFGLLAGAYAGPDATAGAEFTIEWEDHDGRRSVLWQRELNPRDNPAHRGFQSFELDLPTGATGRLVLRTHSRPGHGPGRSWSFWHDLRIAH